MHSTLEHLSHQKKTYYWLYIGGALLLLLSAVLWWTKVSVQPERVLWGTVSNSLASQGATLTIASEQQGTTDTQQIQFSLGKTNTVHALRTVKQNGTTIETESVGNTKKSYTRYTSVITSQKNDDGKSPELSNVLGVWAESSSADQSPLLQQVALGTALPLGAMPIPMGLMQPGDRQELVKEMRQKSLYRINYSKIAKQRKDGKLLYTYDVTMQPVLYLSVMKSFAQHIGLKDLDNLDPERYQSLEDISIQITVDAHSRQVVTVSSKSRAYRENFSGHGVTPDVKLPQKTIPMSELQERLSAVQ